MNVDLAGKYLISTFDDWLTIWPIQSVQRLCWTWRVLCSQYKAWEVRERETQREKEKEREGKREIGTGTGTLTGGWEQEREREREREREGRCGSGIGRGRCRGPRERERPWEWASGREGKEAWDGEGEGFRVSLNCKRTWKAEPEGECPPPNDFRCENNKNNTKNNENK